MPIYQPHAPKTFPLPSVPLPTHLASAFLASSALVKPVSSAVSGKSASVASSAPALQILLHLGARHLRLIVCVMLDSMEQMVPLAPNALQTTSVLVETSLLYAHPTLFPPSRAPMQQRAIVIEVTRAWPTLFALPVWPTPGAGLVC